MSILMVSYSSIAHGENHELSSRLIVLFSDCFTVFHFLFVFLSLLSITCHSSVSHRFKYWSGCYHGSSCNVKYVQSEGQQTLPGLSPITINCNWSITLQWVYSRQWIRMGGTAAEMTKSICVGQSLYCGGPPQINASGIPFLKRSLSLSGIFPSTVLSSVLHSLNSCLVCCNHFLGLPFFPPTAAQRSAALIL